MRELNARQWRLYELLKANSGRYMLQIEIVKNMDGFYNYDPFFDFHGSPARRLLTSDISVLNRSDIIQKIIISTKHGVKIASEEEFRKYINSQYGAIFRKLERTRQKARKAGLDGQMRFVEGRGRDTVEAFSNGINRMRAVRQEKKLRLTDVVFMLHSEFNYLDAPLLSKMETGICIPTNDLIERIAQIYGVSVGELVCEKTVADDNKTAEKSFANGEKGIV